MRMLKVVLLSSIMMGGVASAQEMRIDLSKMPPEVAAQIIKAEQERKGGISVPTTATQVKEYADIGVQMASALAATAKALSIEVNEFVKTPVGWWAFIAIFWYFLGAKLWSIIGGILFWAATMSIVWKSFKTFHMRQRVVVSEEGKIKKYEYQVYSFKSNEAKATSAAFHGIAFAVVTIATMIIIF